MDTYGKFETGLKFLGTLGSKPCFFRSGLMTAVFNGLGTTPDRRLVLMIFRSTGKRISMLSKTILVEIGATAEDVGLDLEIIFSSSLTALAYLVPTL